jgi:hypothetical protein
MLQHTINKKTGGFYMDNLEVTKTIDGLQVTETTTVTHTRASILQNIQQLEMQKEQLRMQSQNIKKNYDAADKKLLIFKNLLLQIEESTLETI